jgi:3'-phosphoadenosine 5'-phosphosulfate sulfotransferase (PAPS reductase)/FAD synthetase
MPTNLGPDLAGYDLILVSTSGGKDSQATLDAVATAAEAAGVSHRVTALHCDLGHVEWPGAADLARRQAAHYRIPIHTRSAPRPLLDDIRRRRRWPAAHARYCTSSQKRDVGRRLITELVHGIGPLPGGRPARVLHALGMRAAESRARARRPVFAPDTAASSGRRQVSTWLPIHDLSTDQVWRRIHRSGVPHHPAYDAGMSRLSCSLCPLAARADITLACQLRPDLAAEYAALETEIGHTFRPDLALTDLLPHPPARPAQPGHPAGTASTQDQP